jgi:thiamine transporter ThiT
MLAFFLGLFMGALGGFLFLGLLSMVAGNERVQVRVEAPERKFN